MDGISRVQSRIRQIQSLLGEHGATNEVVGTAPVAEPRYARCPRPPVVEVGDMTIGRGREAYSPGFRPGDSEPDPAIGRRPGTADFAALIAEASAKTGVSEALIRAVIAAESGFRPDAVSPAGARGLMQLMPGTARALGVTDLFDPRENILGGARYLEQQLTRFGSVEKALAAYNAGPGAVQRYGDVPPFPETQRYVERVQAFLRRYLNRRE
jgi:soluble lytic murein transglycosylase-like protein